MPTPQAAADTLAMSSLEVDLSGVEEGQTITVKWRGKPVFIKHRTEEDIAAATNVPLAGLRDPQSDAERVVDPKVGCGCGEHRAAKRAHNAAHSPLATLRSTGAWVGPRSKPSLQQNPPFCLIRPHPPPPHAVPHCGGRVHAPGLRAHRGRRQLPGLVLPLPRQPLRRVRPHARGARALQPGGARVPVPGGWQQGACDMRVTCAQGPWGCTAGVAPVLGVEM